MTYIYIPYVTIAAVRSQHKVTNLTVNKTRNVKFIIDSGAEVNVMDQDTFESISDVMLDPPSTTLYTYGTKGSRCKLPVVGTMKCKVFAGMTDKMCHAVFHVIKGLAGNLLSCDTSTKLGLISFAKSKSVESESVSDRKSGEAVRVGNSANPIVKEYADRF